MVQAFVVGNSSLLRSIAFVLGAISLVFGGQALGRFSTVTEQGGLYAKLLVAVPAAALFGALFFLLDERLSFFYTQSYNAALGLALTPIAVAVAYGLLLGFIPALSNRNTFSFSQKEMVGGEQAVAIVSALLTLPILFFLGFVLDAQIIFNRLNLVPSVHPDLTAEVVATGVATVAYIVFYFTMGVVQATDGEMGAGGWLFAGVFGCSSCLVLLTGTIMGAISMIFIIRQMGWAFLGFIGLSIVAFLILAGIRLWAENLSGKALTAIFSIPGSIAVIIGFALNNVDKLNLLP